MAMEKKQASVWWVGFFLAVTAAILASILAFVLAVALGILASFIPAVDWLFFTEWGGHVMTLIGLAILWGATAYQAGFTRNRYVIADYGKAVVKATIVFVIIGVLFALYDWSGGYVWGWQDYLAEVLTLVVFYLAAKKYLHA